MHAMGVIKRSIDDRLQSATGVRAEGDHRCFEVPSLCVSEGSAQVEMINYAGFTIGMCL